MHDFIANVNLLIHQNTLLTYIIIYVGTIFLGNLMSFAALWIAFQGLLGGYGVPLVVFTTYAADVSGDMAWYGMGRSLSHTKFGNWIENHLPRHIKIVAAVKRHDQKLVFLSKFLYFSTFPIIFTVGWSRMEFRRFAKASIVTVTVWIPIMTALAYALFSGFSLLHANTVLHRMELFFTFGLLAIISLNYFISWTVQRYLGKRI